MNRAITWQAIGEQRELCRPAACHWKAFTAFPRQAVLWVNPFEKAAWQAIPQGIFYDRKEAMVLSPMTSVGILLLDQATPTQVGPCLMDRHQASPEFNRAEGTPTAMVLHYTKRGLGDCHFDPGLGGLAGGLAAPYPGLGPSMFSIPTGSFVADAQMLGFAGSSAFADKGAARAARPSVSKSVQVSPDSPTAAMAAGAGSEANAKPSAPRPVGKSKKKTNRLCC